jgi:hypothetical protein
MKYFCLTLSVLFVLASCNKTPTVTANRENILRSKKWRISGGTITVKKPNGKDTILQYTSLLPDCYKDDYVTFDSLRHGTMFIGGVACSVADPATRGFTWQLRNNEANIDLYDGFNEVFSATDSIQYYHFDTLGQSPLVLDSIIKMTDTTPGFLKYYIVLDTIRELRFKGLQLPPFDIYGATITNFTESSFTLNFSFKTYYPDSTAWHGGLPYNLPPIYRDDTSHYALIYSSF